MNYKLLILTLCLATASQLHAYTVACKNLTDTPVRVWVDSTIRQVDFVVAAQSTGSIDTKASCPIRINIFDDSTGALIKTVTGGSLGCISRYITIYSDDQGLHTTIGNKFTR